ncbi:MAG: hypothetical protein C4290_14250, partial [Chloroflexota bacterium]
MTSNRAVLEPNAVIAVDVAVFTVRKTPDIQDAWQILLVRREEPAFAGKWSLPGVLVRAEETFDAAARRALQTKAGLDARDWYIEQLGTFGDPGRDTRGRVVSVAHVALVRSDDLQLVPGTGITSIDWLPGRPWPSTTPICCAWPSTASSRSCATPGSPSSSSRRRSPCQSCVPSTPPSWTRRCCGSTPATSRRRSRLSLPPVPSCLWASAPPAAGWAARGICTASAARCWARGNGNCRGTPRNATALTLSIEHTGAPARRPGISAMQEQRLTADLIVVGSGVAGLSAALAAAE